MQLAALAMAEWPETWEGRASCGRLCLSTILPTLAPGRGGLLGVPL